jgi:uncharacterized membrane protein YGL010W
MRKRSKLMDMLTGYAAAHQHPVNVGIHLVCIPVIMLGVLIVLSWARIESGDFSINLAYIAVFGMFLFYLTLDVLFALVFLLFGLLIAFLATLLGGLGFATGGLIAAIAFFGGYLAQFIGHAVERSQPVLLKHPVQANLAAPFFTVVEVFNIAGLRKKLFAEVQAEVEERRREQSRIA